MVTKQEMIELNYNHHKKMTADHNSNSVIYQKVGLGSQVTLNDWFEECANMSYRNLFAEIPHSERCLEVGADYGHRFPILKENFLEVKGIEIYAPHVEKAKAAGNDVRLASIEDTGFPDSYFDAIIGYHVMEHAFDVDKTLREFKRILRPGGYVAMITPHNIPDTEPAHLTQLRKHEWVKKYRQFGFVVISAYLTAGPRIADKEIHLYVIVRKLSLLKKIFYPLRRTLRPLAKMLGMIK
jgi:SAM-dependent methyltransferase